MRRFLVIIVFFLIIGSIAPHYFAATHFEQGVDFLSNYIVDKIVLSGKKHVAVVDFVNVKGIATDLGRFFAEEFTVKITGKKKGFLVIERNRLKPILKEYNLLEKGIINPQTAKEFGNFSGVDALVTGTLTPWENGIRVSVKILDIESAAVLGAISGNITLTKELMAINGSNQKDVNRNSDGSKTSIEVVTAMKYTFKIFRCKLSGQQVICDLTITNNETYNRRFILNHSSTYGITSLFDNFGNEYGLTEAHIANSSNDFARRGYTRKSSLKKVLIPGVETNLRLIFQGISDETTAVSTISIACASDRALNRFRINLRNIPLKK
jgi:TolB-like protein